MLDLLKRLFNKIESVRGKNLVILFIVIFVVFTLIGISIGYFMTGKLKENENIDTGLKPSTSAVPEKTYLEGKVIYFNPEVYPQDNVSYRLVDSSGKELIILKSKDQRLSIVEGLNVKVSGKIEKLSDGKTDVLNVSEVIIKNATN